MKRLGTAVWWSISDEVLLTPEVMKAAGFESEIPRNEPKTALIKACKAVKKEWEIRDADIGATESTPETLKRGDHKRFVDTATECRIALTRPRLSHGGDTFGVETVLVITLTKATKHAVASIAFEPGPDVNSVEFGELSGMIRTEYDKALTTIDATQLRLLVSGYVSGSRRGCNAVSMRPFSGGIYFVPEAYQARIERIKTLFGTDKSKMVFSAHALYDDGSEASEAVSHHVTVAFEKETKAFLAALASDLKEGISKRALEGRVALANEMKDKITAYKDHLATRAAEFDTKASQILRVMEARLNDAKGKTIEPFDLLAELASIDEQVERARALSRGIKR